MYIYVCIHIYSVYMLLYKKASLLFLWVNTFYSTITITTVYIPNQNASIVYQEDIGLKQSVDHDQWQHAQCGCNVECVFMCACIWVWNSFPLPSCLCACQTNTQTHTFPLHTHDTCAHTQTHTYADRKWCVQQLVWFALPRQSKHDLGSISATLQSSEQLADGLSGLFLQLLSLCFQTNLARFPDLKPNSLQEWARHTFPSLTHKRSDLSSSPDISTV